jgi:hypothetical protein
MKAERLLDERYLLDEDTFAEIVIWRLPDGPRGSTHRYKYRLALVENGTCTLRYDNEAGKGDHRHIGSREESYIFTSPEELLNDFWSDVDERKRR